MYLITFRAWCDIHLAKKTFEKRSSSSTIKSIRVDKKSFEKDIKEFNFSEDDKTLGYLVDPVFKAGDIIE